MIQIKKLAPIALFLAFLSCISGYLMSKPSLVGRIGINVFYREYRFLQTWWQGALVVFITLLIILLIHHLVYQKLQKKKAVIIYIIMFLLALVGFYFTWQDFHSTTTHRWLKERFHIGAYLFWLGWAVISLYFISQNIKKHSIA